MFHQLLDKAEAGDNCGILIKNVKRDEIKRGMVMAVPKTISMHNHIKAQVGRPLYPL